MITADGQPSGEVHDRMTHTYLLFELTRRCHNNCVFCYNVWKEEEDYPRDELTVDEAKRVLDKVFDETECRFIGLTGGEPLLKEGVFEIASHIASRGRGTVLISNGKLLTAETVRRCLDGGIEYFEVSLHSHEREIHDHLAGRGGSFDEAIDAILNVIELGAHVNTVFVATRDNIGSFKEFVELNALLRVEWILFNRVACGGRGIDNWERLVPNPSQVQEAIDVGAPLALKYKIGLSAGVQMPPCLVDLSKHENVATSFCPLNVGGAGHSYFVIDPAGNVRMCNRSKVLLGNLLEDSFQNIVRSTVVEDFCSAVPDFCRDCKLAGTCAGGCKADALSYFGTLAKPDPFVEIWKHHAVKKR